MDIIFIIFYGIFKIFKGIVMGIVNTIKFVLLKVFKLEFLPAKSKETINRVEALVEDGWESPIPITDLPDTVSGLTTLEIAPTSVEFFPESTLAVKSVPFRKMPKTFNASFAVKNGKLARWQLHFFKEAVILLERKKAFISRYSNEKLSFSGAKTFKQVDKSFVKRIPVEDRFMLALGGALYLADNKQFALQNGYELGLSYDSIPIASLKFSKYDAFNDAASSIYEAKHGSAPDNDAMNGIISPAPYKDLLTEDERSKAQEVLGVKGENVNLENLIKKYSLLNNNQNSSASNSSNSGSKNPDLDKIWDDMDKRLFPRKERQPRTESIKSAASEISSAKSSLSSFSSSYDSASSSSSSRSSSRSSRSESSSSSRKEKEVKKEKKEKKEVKKPQKRDTRYEEERVRRCQAELARQKQNRDTAKQNGNYKRSSKNYRKGDKVGTVYDANVWAAEEELRRAKEALARARKG